MDLFTVGMAVGSGREVDSGKIICRVKGYKMLSQLVGTWANPCCNAVRARVDDERVQ